MIANTKILKLKDISDEKGYLGFAEGNRDIPFGIKRIYFITKVGPNIRRGFHSHRLLDQVLVCLSGSVKVLIKTPYEEETVELNDPTAGLYIGPMIWREMFDFSSDAVLLVIASEYYDEADYIRDYDKYQIEAEAFFKKSK